MGQIDFKKALSQILSNQQLEKNITEHKVFYKKYLIGISNRRTLLNKLHELHGKLENTPLTSPLHINKPLIAVNNEIEAFLHSAFSNEVLKLYNTEINPPESKRKIPPIEESFWMSLLGTLVASMETSNEKYKQQWMFKRKFLQFLHSCIENYGLHPDILRRNLETYKRYNIIVHHDYKSRKQLVEVKILLNKDELETEFLLPYSERLPIKMNGKLIPFKNLCMVKYTTTLLLDDELELFALKNGFPWTQTNKNELEFANICVDETNTLHKNPYLKNGRMLRNNLTLFIAPERIEELKKIKSKDFDLTRLIGLCQELNNTMAAANHVAVSLLVRALIDHVPPVFGFQNFGDFANQYRGGTKSFKKSMINLNSSLRNIADANIHTQARAKDILPSSVQTDFTPELDLLLSEVVRKLK